MKKHQSLLLPLALLLSLTSPASAAPVLGNAIDSVLSGGPVLWIGILVVLLVIFWAVKSAVKWGVRLLVASLVVGGGGFVGWQNFLVPGEAASLLRGINLEEVQSSPQAQDLIGGMRGKLNDALASSKSKGEDAYRKTLEQANLALEEKIKEASKSGVDNAKGELLKIKDDLQSKLRGLGN